MLASNTFLETFDRKKLATILRYKDFFRTIISPEIEDDKYDPFVICQKYLDSGCGKKLNKVSVSYRRSNGVGRQFADGGVSLQSMPRAIRGTIAGDFYIDIDMVNAHPVIISEICRQKGINVANLNIYILYRDTVITNILENNPDNEYADIKQMILSILYGGNAHFNKLANKTEWLINYKKEIEELHERVPELFPQPYHTIANKKINKFNINGSVLSSIVCVAEDKLLQIMINYLKDNEYICDELVMCFDGLMIPKTKLVLKDLDKIINDVQGLYTSKGFNIKLKRKKFETLDLGYIPDQFITQQQELERDVKVVNYRDRYLYDEYYWGDFMEQMSITHSNYDSFAKKFKENVNRVLFRIKQTGAYSTKISEDIMFSFDKTLMDEEFAYMDVKPGTNEPMVCYVKLSEMLKKLGGFLKSIKSYSNLNFDPKGCFENIEDKTGDFNMWDGFKAKLLPMEEVNMDLVNIVLNHIKMVWCAGNDEYYWYMLSWFKLIFTDPKRKSKVAIILKSHEQQIGKGILINQFLIKYIFGPRYSMSIAGIEPLTAKFNELLMNKLLITADELSNIDGSYHESFNIIKARITEPTTKIEIKNGKMFNYPDFSNYLLCTNHDFTVKIEQGDARYFVLECSPIYRGNEAYFNKLKATFTQETADMFFTYIANQTENIVEIRNIPSTPLKTEMIIAGLPSPCRFLLDIKEEFDIRNDPENKENEGEHHFNALFNAVNDGCLISGAIFYFHYREWCGRFGERIVSNTTFGREIKYYITKKKSSCVKYDISTININL